MLIKSKVLHKVRASLEKGSSLQTACTMAGIRGKATIYRWREKSPRVNRYILACLERGNTARVTKVEDFLYQRLISDKASPIECIFYLTNRAPDRWKDRRAIVNNMNVDAGTHYTQIWNAVEKKAKDVESDGRVHLRDQKEVQA